ncbi:DUF1365 domain-containing protein [Pseudomonas fontis]|uniref:DUF1365 domain-containing protein n=1 Tax=Pseudomonas fontis TaxID=2942633 RepID=A0ABT5NY06_9PSED|nr:DUF1365 domain-containing protein [Pseudomonas fontis]MDD0977486.1 DUF1365 domain-containing protein [Pseudomonas fontis]MDD0993090.1 DUF1365 domain-containing protein [Pseudomonas fontis]
MNSALYLGWVSHRRFAKGGHAFAYRMGLLYLDLDEQDAVLALSPLAGRGRFAAFAFREQDYLPAFTQAGQPLIEAVRDQLEAALGHRPQGPVCLLTQPRSWGLAFNPVSFFYCHEADGRLAAILCEVTNTPWRQRFHYVLPAANQGPWNFSVAKAFHVSPFLPADLEYRMHFCTPGQHVRVRMEDWQGDTRVFSACLQLTRIALGRASLHRYLLSFPWMAGKTVLAIYWQALRLLLKRNALFSHFSAHGAWRLARLRPEESPHEEP